MTLELMLLYFLTFLFSTALFVEMKCNRRKAEIRVYVEGGVVQDVTGIPPEGITVKVCDYDIDGSDDDNLETDDEGCSFHSCIYTGSKGE